MRNDLSLTETKILNTIRRFGHPVDRGSIAETTGYSLPTVTAALSKLEGQSFLLKREKEREKIQLSPSAMSFVGISVGTGRVKIIIIDANFDLRSDKVVTDLYNVIREVIDTQLVDLCIVEERSVSNPEGLCFENPWKFKALRELLNVIISECIHNEKLNIQGVGIAFPGLINDTDAIIHRCQNLDFLDDKNLEKDLLQSSLIREMNEKDIIVVIQHNAKCAAIAEKEKSPVCLTGEKNLACLYLGTGIGVGYVLDNKLHHGNKNYAGQIGHVKLAAPLIHPQNTINSCGKCACGQYGCVEHLLRFEVFGAKTPEDFRRVTFSDGEPLEEGQIENTAKYVAYVISLLVTSLSLDTIVLTGKLSKVYDQMWEHLSAHYVEYCYAGMGVEWKPRTSVFGGLAPAVGAAMYSYFRKYKCDLDWNR